MEKLLFTGGTGFLGRNVRPILDKIYDVTTCGITPEDMLKANLAVEVPILDKHYDIVLHACGKAHMVPKSETDKQAFYDVNYQGTVNICNALEKAGVPKALIFISTVAVYGCETGSEITEEHPLLGTSPYADSKIQAERFLNDWAGRNGVVLGIIRPSLIAGPNPPGNLGAMINGIKSGRYLSIAGSKARKSVLMVEDIAKLVPLLAEKGGIYNVCDSYNPSFRELEEVICKQLGKGLPVSVPYWIAKCLALAGDCLGSKAPINSLKLDKITKPLTFSNKKAIEILGWEPSNVLENFKIC